ncbi:hypothetical protein ABIB06_007653 [Bradyrhizobium sp. LB8.2]|uniref:hypothetical protein n=1 Tax=unclassified Bradyrhizobium TaxID=2631580 RepID=UPI00339968BB
MSFPTIYRQNTTAGLMTFALLIGSATTAAYSQATSTAPRPAQSDLFRFSFNPTFTPANRIELSRRFEGYCHEVLDAVPTNTPAEDAWVIAESKTSDLNRVTRLVSTKEWARYRLKETFSECLQKIAVLQQAQANNARSAEAAQFISLAYTFNQDTDLAAFAKRVDLKSGLELNLFRQVLMIAAMRTLDGRDDK